MNCRHSLVTENEFFQATGLDSRSRRKFEELGFLKPMVLSETKPSILQKIWRWF